MMSRYFRNLEVASQCSAEVVLSNKPLPGRTTSEMLSRFAEGPRNLIRIRRLKSIHRQAILCLVVLEYAHNRCASDIARTPERSNKRKLTGACSCSC